MNANFDELIKEIDFSNESISIELELKNSGNRQRYVLVQDIIDNQQPTWCLIAKDPNLNMILTIDSSTGALCLGDEDKEKFTPESIENLSEYLVQQSAEIISNYGQGFDDAQEIVEQSKPSYLPNQIQITNKNLSLWQMVDMLNGDEYSESEIVLNPDFQRNFVWDQKRRSRLIESILLGLPLPSFYFSELEDGKLAVVDGVQRLTTIKLFFNNELRLTHVDTLLKCKDKLYKEIEEENLIPLLQLRRIKQTQLACYIIDSSSPDELKYDLFSRLNAGSCPLNSSEIRNCISRQNLQKAIKEMTAEPFGKATCYSVNTLRMLDKDMAMRFMYFYSIYQDTDHPFAPYDGNIEKALNSQVGKLNKLRYEELEETYINPYKQALKLSHKLFGRYAFRKIYKVGERRRPINKLLMTIVTVLLAKYADDYTEKAQSINLCSALVDLMNTDKTFDFYLAHSTTTKSNMEYVAKTLKTKIFDANLL